LDPGKEKGEAFMAGAGSNAQRKHGEGEAGRKGGGKEAGTLSFSPCFFLSFFFLSG
jgi:hypothetical protein